MFRTLLARGRAVRAQVIYRLDSLLGLPPLVQVLGILGLTFALVLVWALLLRPLTSPAADIPRGTEAVWWSLTHFFDGGTMAGDPADRRLVALGATVCGVIVLSLLTAALTSKITERIADLRSGLNAVVERQHILVLGFDPNVALMIREVAKSRQRRTVVILAADSKDDIESALRPALDEHGARLRLVVRIGDPRSEPTLLRVSADRASAIMVVPPGMLNDEPSVHWTLSTLLAVRRVVDQDFQGKVIVQARHEEARQVLMLAAEAGVAGSGAMAIEIVAADDLLSRVLAQSVRHEGVYFALRRMLAFNGCEIYLQAAPPALVGKTFDEAHAIVEGAVVLGIRHPTGKLSLAPRSADRVVLAASDRLVLLAPGKNPLRFGGVLPPPMGVLCAVPAVPRPQTVFVMGFNRMLPLLLRELDDVLPPGSKVLVASGACDSSRPNARLVVDAACAALVRTSGEHDSRTPCQVIQADHDAVYSADAVVILGCEHDDDDGDASALANLLWLRRGMQRTGKSIRRVITELRDPRSALHVLDRDHDFVVSSGIVAMLLAQEALDPDVAPVFRELLSPAGVEIFLRPREEYFGKVEATFADAAAVARSRGEVAIGFMPAAPRALEDQASRRLRLERGESQDSDVSPLYLNPLRSEKIPVAEDASILVLARSPVA